MAERRGHRSFTACSMVGGSASAVGMLAVWSFGPFASTSVLGLAGFWPAAGVLGAAGGLACALTAALVAGLAKSPLARALLAAGGAGVSALASGMVVLVGFSLRSPMNPWAVSLFFFAVATVGTLIYGLRRPSDFPRRRTR